MSTDMTALAPVAPHTLATERTALAVAEVASRVRRIQEVMATLMKEGTHYGTIPGTPKPTLFQAGAELLCMTFRIAATPRVTDLSSEDCVRYRVTMEATSQATGELLGAGIGECSSDEEKYRWRRPTCDEEWQETPEDQRRERWIKTKTGAIKIKQVRTPPADVANTILKMAAKRALIAMARTVLACSDIFAQDLEDLPPEVVETLTQHEAGAPTPAIRPPQRRAKPEPEPVAAEPPPAPTPAGTAPSVAAAAPPPPTAAATKPSKPGTGGPPPILPRPLLVTKVETREGQSEAGRAWKLYTVHLSDGRRTSTFDTTVGEAAAQFHAAQVPVRVLVEAGKRDGTWDLVEIQQSEVQDDMPF